MSETYSHKAVREATLAKLREVIRDAFLEGRDDEATAILQSEDYRLLQNGELRRKAILGIRSMNIPPGTGSSAAFISVRPQIAFTAKRFMVVRSCSWAFVILDFRVGTHSMFLTGGSETHAGLFASNIPSDLTPEIRRSLETNTPTEILLNDPILYTCGLEIDFDRCEVGQDLSVLVENTSLEPQTFFGAYLGVRHDH